MEPILKYPGAKWRLADWIISYFPEHESYLEPFAGSLAVFLNKPPARIETVNDLGGNIVRFFRTCRECPDELARAIDLTPWARKEFEESKDFQVDDDVEFARRFAVRCWMAFGAGLYRTTGWRNTTGKIKDGGPDNPKLWNRVPEIVHAVADRLKTAQIENRPAVDIMLTHDGPNVLIYCDPPYVRSTRTLHGDQYLCEMTDADHTRFLEVAAGHQGMILISGYDCDLYRKYLAGWKCERLRTTAERGRPREECLWINPACALALQRERAQCRIF